MNNFEFEISKIRNLVYDQPTGFVIHYKLEEKGSNMVIHTHISNPTDKIAFFVNLSLNNEKGESICPVFWDDNYISMLPGEKRDISCTLVKSILKETKPEILLTGWNVKQQKLSVK